MEVLLDKQKDGKSPLHLLTAITYLGQDAGPEERYDGNYSNDTHVTDPLFHRLFGTPQTDRCQCNEENKVMRSGQWILILPHSRNLEIVLPAVTDMKESPNSYDRNTGNRQGDGEPLKPRQRNVHTGKSNEVLWGGDWRGLSANIGSQGDGNLYALKVVKLTRLGNSGIANLQSDTWRKQTLVTVRR